ncbi:HhH-GPD family protein [Corynebacterium auriscanis]|uniref:A/G-specific adenine glycosylase n=1 Tax=Corynebacterium auriscanis TaxID=99807 RepID=UPI0022477D7F|nr:A/G-specific adenine glycosylase [Corynebacterium auriscanis]MCX2163495.1 A/G-specific adenine glycosylase [Corynebacterium auriscanis]
MPTPDYPLATSAEGRLSAYPIDRLQFARDLNHWFARHGRVLPWRHPDTSPWAILVSEVMSQQTPVSRVIPLWEAWMRRWPQPADLAVASKAEVLRMWANLGYPRRALRLQECARDCTQRHDGNVPNTIAELEALSGIGSYTARAVAAFAFEQAVPVVDTNVRRVLHRVVFGSYLQGPARARDLVDVAELMPWVDPDPFLVRRHVEPDHHDPQAHEDAQMMTASLMELGALICRAKNPQCDQCPVRKHCQWVAAGRPEPSAQQKASAAKRVQKFEGTDRQVRGKIMGLLRSRKDSRATGAEIDLLWHDKAQLTRAVNSLVADGLAERTDGHRQDATTSNDPSNAAPTEGIAEHTEARGERATVNRNRFEPKSETGLTGLRLPT